jgi:hypothetical protein
MNQPGELPSRWRCNNCGGRPVDDVRDLIETLEANDVQR